MSYMSEIDAAGATPEEVGKYMLDNPKGDHEETFEAALDHFWDIKIAKGGIQEETFEEAMERL